MRWFASGAGTIVVAIVAASWGCTIDPGANFVIPLSVFNEDFFYCHVEPQYIYAAQTQCGAGGSGDNGNCHFNSSAVSGMALIDHPLINCGGGDHPVQGDPAGSGAVGPNSPANANFSAVSLEMSRNCPDYASCQAPVLTRPTKTDAHPRQIFDPANDPAALQNIIYQWAATP